MKEFIDMDARAAMSEVIEREKPRSVLLFTGSQSFEQSPLKDFFDQLPSEVSVTRYSNFQNNPNYNDLVRAVKKLNLYKPDLIIAAGGGSVMDFAKLVNIYLENQEALNRYVPTAANLRPAAPMVMIPTTSGSGSEATSFMVLFKNGRKFSLVCPYLNIDYVILDPALTHSLTPRQTAVSGIDALCQGIESLWARSSTLQSREFARKAIELIYPNIRNAVWHPDAISRRAMSLGSYFAGKAISISKTTGPHAFSYFLTEKMDIPHGEAVAINMELFMELNFPHLPEDRTAEYFMLFQVDSKEELIRKFSNLKRELKLKMTLKDAGVDSEETLKEYLKYINHERMMNNPKRLTHEIIYEELKRCIK